MPVRTWASFYSPTPTGTSHGIGWELITPLAVHKLLLLLKQENDMPAIIMWLLGVPLIVIVLLYLIF